MLPWIIVTLLSIALIVTVWGLGIMMMNFVDKQEQFEDALEERVDTALKILDKSYMEIVFIANKPVFFDSPEVRAVTAAIQRSRDAVVNVGALLSDIDIIEDETKNVELEAPKYVGEENFDVMLPMQPKQHTSQQKVIDQATAKAAAALKAQQTRIERSKLNKEKNS